MQLPLRGLFRVSPSPTWASVTTSWRAGEAARPATRSLTMRASPKRRRGILLLAALLTIYTMAGFLLALRVATDRAERYRWWLIAATAGAFAIASGITTLSVWRVEKRAPALLVACGVLGSALCLALPAAAPADSLPAGMWRSAIQGAVLILAFLLLAAWYVRGVVRART